MKPKTETKLTFIIMTIIVIMLLLSCNSPDKKEVKTENKMEYIVFEIEGCEYIWYKIYSQYGQTMAHKGNCKNPIHCYN